MKTTNNPKVIDRCPVCKSLNIEQQITSMPWFGDSDHYAIYGSGSYCNNCGTKFQFNTTHLDEDLAKEKAMIKKAIAKGKKLAGR